MSFPNIIHGSYGDEKVTSSTKVGGHDLGTLMILPDGRKFRYAKSGGSALAVGIVLRQGGMYDVALDQDLAVGTNRAIGALEVNLVLGAASTAVVANYYEDGYLYTNLEAGLGSVYKIESHRAQTVASDTVGFMLYPSDPLKLAIIAGSTKCGLQTNEYATCLVAQAGTIFSGSYLGIPPVAVSAGWYFWVQRSGPAVGLIAGTGTDFGEGFTCSTVGADVGEITVSSTASNEAIDRIGHTMAAGAAGSYILVNLELE